MSDDLKSMNNEQLVDQHESAAINWSATFDHEHLVRSRESRAELLRRLEMADRLDALDAEVEDLSRARFLEAKEASRLRRQVFALLSACKAIVSYDKGEYPKGHGSEAYRAAILSASTAIDLVESSTPLVSADANWCQICGKAIVSDGKYCDVCDSTLNSYEGAPDAIA